MVLQASSLFSAHVKELKFINHKVSFQLCWPDWCAAAETQTKRFNVTGLWLYKRRVWPRAGHHRFKFKTLSFCVC